MKEAILTPQECALLLPYQPSIGKTDMAQLKKQTSQNGANAVEFPYGLLISEDKRILNGRNGDYKAIFAALFKYNIEARIVKDAGEVNIASDYFLGISKGDGREKAINVAVEALERSRNPYSITPIRICDLVECVKVSLYGYSPLTDFIERVKAKGNFRQSRQEMG